MGDVRTLPAEKIAKPANRFHLMKKVYHVVLMRVCCLILRKREGFGDLGLQNGLAKCVSEKMHLVKAFWVSFPRESRCVF